MEGILDWLACFLRIVGGHCETTPSGKGDVTISLGTSYVRIYPMLGAAGLRHSMSYTCPNTANLNA